MKYSYIYSDGEAFLACRGVRRGPHLKYSEDGGRKGVKVCSWSLIFKVKPREKQIQNYVKTNMMLYNVAQKGLDE